MSTSVTQHAIWQRLGDHARHVIEKPLEEMVDGAGRFERMCISTAGLTVDFSRQRMDGATLDALVDLSQSLRLRESLDTLMTGGAVNVTEHRPALHTALRAEIGEHALVESTIEPQRQRMLAIAERIRSGDWRGYSGKAIRDVVHIGIGGSYLGPALVTEALPATWGAPRCHFLANVDGTAALEILRDVSPETTLFVIVSKSFATVESRINAESVRAWFIERTGAPDVIQHHMLAVTSNIDAATAYGISADAILPMWDWVGGRYSVWSSVGLPIAIHAGSTAFREFLQGARAMDRHARSTPSERNLPILLALIGIWNLNFLGAQTHVVMPYAHGLRHLPDYLQQLEMESNGKSVRGDGTKVDLQTAAVVWGGEETNGQHAFHQFLHQGTRAFSADFVVSLRAGRDLGAHHDWLLANCLAQAEALLVGRHADDPHRAMPGHRGSTIIVLDAISPGSLGALLALYEHKVYCQGIIWGINPFDQWGVELGKTIADSLHGTLTAGAATSMTNPTRRLIETIVRRRKYP